MTITIELVFGAMAPSILEQLQEQDLCLPAGNVEYRQAEADAITRLLVQGLITQRTGMSARKKLMDRIKKEAQPRSVMDGQVPMKDSAGKKIDGYWPVGGSHIKGSKR